MSAQEKEQATEQLLYEELTLGKAKVKDEATMRHVLEYLSELSAVQVKAIRIASNHLGSSFNIVKSNGYVDWKKEKKY